MVDVMQPYRIRLRHISQHMRMVGRLERGQMMRRMTESEQYHDLRQSVWCVDFASVDDNWDFNAC